MKGYQQRRPKIMLVVQFKVLFFVLCLLLCCLNLCPFSNYKKKHVFVSTMFLVLLIEINKLKSNFIDLFFLDSLKTKKTTPDIFSVSMYYFMSIFFLKFFFYYMLQDTFRFVNENKIIIY